MIFIINAFRTVVLWLSSLRSVLSISGIAGFFGAIYTGATSLVLQGISLLVAARLYKFAFIGGLIGTFYGAITGILDGLATGIPSQFVDAIGMFLPWNTPALVAAVLSAHALRALYNSQSFLVKYM